MDRTREEAAGNGRLRSETRSESRSAAVSRDRAWSISTDTVDLGGGGHALTKALPIAASSP